MFHNEFIFLVFGFCVLCGCVISPWCHGYFQNKKDKFLSGEDEMLGIMDTWVFL